MYQQTYYVSKQTDTFADAFLAYGLLTLLDSVLATFAENRWVRIRDAGPYYAIELSHTLQQEWVAKAHFQALAKYIKTGREERKTLSHLPASIIIDYRKEWDKFQKYIHTSSDVKEKMSQEQLAQIKPHPDFPVFAWVGNRGMQALLSYNELILRWQKLGKQVRYFRECLRQILMLCSTPDWNNGAPENAVGKRVKRLRLNGTGDATLIQLLNPSQGKGLNEPKASRLQMRNIKSFWVLEYLKAVGMYCCSVPRRVKDSDDFKTYALAPTNMRLDINNEVLAKFQEALWNDTAVKMDVLASLRYSRCFLEWCEMNQGQELAAELLGHGPENFVSGMYVTYYKRLGQASAVMNMSFIELPRWMLVRSPDDLKKYREIIEEHEKVIQSIDEEKGGYDLLVHYRDFLSGGRWEAFFDFSTAYISFLMKELNREHYWVKPFTTHRLEALIVRSNEQLRPILESAGFRNIAEAIRRSTITTQYMKHSENPSEYEVRYGLGQELKRKVLYNDEFIASLSQFMQSYNAENARVNEKTTIQYRKNVLTTDIDDVVRLVDTYGAATVGNLLIAYGYAREPKEEQEKSE